MLKIMKRFYKIIATTIIAIIVFGWLFSPILEQEEKWIILLCLLGGGLWGFIIGYVIGYDKHRNELLKEKYKYGTIMGWKVKEPTPNQ